MRNGFFVADLNCIGFSFLSKTKEKEWGIVYVGMYARLRSKEFSRYDK